MEFKKAPEKKKEPMEGLQTKMLNWPDCYYREREPELRLALLDEADRQGLTPEDNVFRRKLFALRYPDSGKPGGGKLDMYIRLWIEMRYLYENSRGFFGRGPNPKRLQRELKKTGYYEAETQQEKNLLYQEFYHLGLLYIALCQEDKQYASLLLGLSRMSDEALARKIASEYNHVAIGTPELYNMKEECALFTRAVTQAWRDMFPDHAELLEEV